MMISRKMKLLAIGLAVLTVSSGLVVVLLGAGGNKTHPVNTIRVACVGDSITEGTEYPADLWMLLGADYTVSNFGVGGSTVSLKSPKPYMNETAFQKAKEFLPNIVVIMLGTNDANPAAYQNIESFVDDYKKLVSEFQALASKPKVWLVEPPPIFNNGTGLSTVFFMHGVLPRIEQVANETNLPAIDAYAALAEHPEYFQDGVHPNSEGAKLIAIEIYKAIIFGNSGLSSMPQIQISE
jgi:lysophospholipase L1-like esterase